MYVKHAAAADPDSPVTTRRLIHDDHTNAEPVAFHPETGVAQVTEDVGEALVEHYDSIVRKEADSE